MEHSMPWREQTSSAQTVGIAGDCSSQSPSAGGRAGPFLQHCCSQNSLICLFSQNDPGTAGWHFHFLQSCRKGWAHKVLRSPYGIFYPYPVPVVSLCCCCFHQNFFLCYKLPLNFCSVDGTRDIFMGLLYDQHKKGKSMLQFSVESCLSNVQGSPGHQSWNKISVALPEAVQLWFGFFWGFFSPPGAKCHYFTRG